MRITKKNCRTPSSGHTGLVQRYHAQLLHRSFRIGNSSRLRVKGFGVQSLGFRVSCLRFGAWGLESKAQGLERRSRHGLVLTRVPTRSRV